MRPRNPVNSRSTWWVYRRPIHRDALLWLGLLVALIASIPVLVQRRHYGSGLGLAVELAAGVAANVTFVGVIGGICRAVFSRRRDCDGP